MAINFACECGKSYSVDQKHAGKKTRCKVCGGELKVPSPADAPAEFVPTLPVVEDIDEIAAVAVIRPAAPRRMAGPAPTLNPAVATPQLPAVSPGNSEIFFPAVDPRRSHSHNGGNPPTAHTAKKGFQGIPGWAWIFVVACGAIPVATLGGGIPCGIGFGGAGGCLAIARKEMMSVGARVGACIAITVGCWMAVVLLVVVVAFATHRSQAPSPAGGRITNGPSNVRSRTTTTSSSDRNQKPAVQQPLISPPAQPRPAVPSTAQGVSGTITPLPGNMKRWTAGEQTDVSGGGFGGAFTETGPVEGFLVGFRTTTRPAFGAEALSSVQPIYEVPGGKRYFGAVYGVENDRLTVTEAPKQLAVAAITARSRMFCNGFEVHFRSVRGRSLEREGGAKSSWVGHNSGTDTRLLDGKGRWIVGICGKANPQGICALGLILSPEGEVNESKPLALPMGTTEPGPLATLPTPVRPPTPPVTPVQPAIQQPPAPKAASRPAPPQPISSVETALAAAVGTDRWKQSAAGKWLIEVPRNQVTDEQARKITATLGPLIRRDDYGVREVFAKAFSRFATAADIDRLLEMTTWEEKYSNCWGPAMAALVVLEPKKSSQILEQRLDNFTFRVSIVPHLQKLDQSYEAALLPLLKSKNKGIRENAIELLGDTGTSKAIGPITQAYQAAPKKEQFFMKRRVEAAIGKIKQREAIKKK